MSNGKMTWIISIFLIAVIGAGLLIISLRKHEVPVSDPLPKNFNENEIKSEWEGRKPLILKIGEETTLSDGSVFKFVDVIEDSRCPRDATCAWLGQARIRVSFTPPGLVSALQTFGSFVQETKENTLVNPNGIKISLDEVRPYPETNENPISKDSYFARFLISAFN